METVADKTARYRAAIKDIMTRLAASQYAGESIRDRAIFDAEHDSYAVIAEGWGRDEERVHFTVADLEIVNGKVWIHADNTDIVIARKLEERGIPKSDIVLGFRAPEVRAETEYAVA